MEEKKVGYTKLAIISCLVMVLSIGIAVYMMFFQKPTGKITKESTKTEEKVKDSNGILTQSSLDKISLGIIDESLSRVGILIEKDYNGVDLLQNQNFKFAFAFFFGRLEYADYYSEDSSVKDYESCGIAISFDNYKKVYKNIYGEDYTSNTIPDGTDFKMTDKGIFGCIITGYGGRAKFEKEASENGEYLAAIKAVDDERGWITTGHMKIAYNAQKDGLLSIKKIIITYND